MQVEGTILPTWLLRVDEQAEVGADGYDQGAAILREFFLRELKGFLQTGLDKRGRQIIECCMDGGATEDYEAFLPSVDLRE